MKKVIAPVKSQRKRISRLGLVIGNWMIKRAREEGEDPDLAKTYAEGIKLADHIHKYFNIKE